MSPGPQIRWLGAFLDVPPQDAAAVREFWSRVTGWPESEPRGDRGQFRSLVPPHGPAYLRVQELARPARVHLDLASSDLEGDRHRAEELGALHVSSDGDVVVLISPAGLPFCLVLDDTLQPEVVDADLRAPAWPRGHRSRPAQVTLDVPDDWYDDEVAFWTAVTGWTARQSGRPEFMFLVPEAGAPLQLLLQRLEPDAEQRTIGAHLDIGTDDVAGEVVRLLELGALDGGRGEGWWVMRDPVLGQPFCVTPQQP